MNEADLDQLLRQGSRRLRIAWALRGALVVLGLSLVMTAALLFLWRTYSAVPAAEVSRMQALQALLVFAPLSLSLLAFGLLYSVARPAERRAAGELDRAANLQDHLLTWLDLRGKTLEAVPAEFRAAQTRETLRRAEGLSATTLLPMKLPAWTPALWLALILLCSALLAPPQVEVEARAAAREREAQRRMTPALAASPEMQPQRSAATPRVQPLSPTELWTLQLRASEPGLTADQKKHLLNELQQKLGAIPESELTAEIRELLGQLREADTAAKTTDKTLTAGSAQASNKSSGETSQAQAAAVNTVTLRERGLARAESDFVDVKEELIRYYRGGSQQ